MARFWLNSQAESAAAGADYANAGISAGRFEVEDLARVWNVSNMKNSIPSSICNATC